MLKLTSLWFQRLYEARKMGGEGGGTKKVNGSIAFAGTHYSNPYA